MCTRYGDTFPALLDCFSLETLEKHPSSVYGLCSDLTFNYFNPAWFRFSEENGGEPAVSERYRLGAHIGCAIAGPAKDFYLQSFAEVLKTKNVWHHEYECSSPELFRLFHQTAYPLHNGGGIIVVHALVLVHQHEAGAGRSPEDIDALYLQKNGLITQCSNCRRVQRAAKGDVWDWVPALVAHMPDNISHSFCEVCFDYYFAARYGSNKRK